MVLLLFVDEESIESMYKYLIKEGQVKEHPEFLFLGQYDSKFIPVMEHLVILCCYFLSFTLNLTPTSR